MKTIMIVPELPCKNCHKYESNACVECFNKNGKKEQVPETFDELKQLCKDNDKIGIGLEFIEYDNFTIVFKREGKILGCGDDLIIAENRTPQQMWNIIKSLIGEE